MASNGKAVTGTAVMARSANEEKKNRIPFVLDLKTRFRFVDHTSWENIIARCDRRKRDRTVIDLLAGRSNLHPCFRIRREIGSGSSHGEEEVNCRVGGQ